MKSVCINSNIPLHSEATHKSEMVNQILFGELFSIIEEKEEWVKIVLQHDNYEGWIEKQPVKLISDENFESLRTKAFYYTTDIMSYVRNLNTNTLLPVSFGSRFYGLKIFSLDTQNYEIFDNTIVLPGSSKNIEQLSQKFLNSPYLWGGRTPLGIDCSGFTQLIYSIAGINLPRDAYQQAKIGKEVSSLKDSMVNDLLFFGKDNLITHVGILLSENKIIHCSGRVKIDYIDSKGIKCSETGKYTHNLKLIRRIL